MRVLIINGPNLNLLGKREPNVYGAATIDDLNSLIDKWAPRLGIEASAIQSNSENVIIETIQQFDGDGIVLNPGAYTHTSHAIADAIRGVSTPVVEVHVSNIRKREPWRSVSLVSDACVRSIYGRGFSGYRDAMRHLVNRAAVPFETVRYGPHTDNVADLRRGGPDLVVLAHGGLWRHEHERDSTESLAVDLNRKGLSTLNLEYRRLGDGGGWPGSGHDVLTALDSLNQLGLGGGRVMLVSHSAGSYLLSWAGERSTTEAEIHIALAPVFDLGASVRTDDPCSRESAVMVDSGAPEVVEPVRVPTAIVHGDSDQIVPIAHSESMAERTGFELHSTDSDHFALLDPTKSDWAWVCDRLGI